jgi:hypothetical protein
MCIDPPLPPWMAGGLVTYYAINGMFATHL